MAVRVRIELDAEASKLQATVQKAVTKGFQGAGKAGILSDPTDILREFLGPEPGAGMKRKIIGSRAFSTPKLPDFLNNPEFFKSKNLQGISELLPRKQSAFSGLMEKAGIPGSAVALRAAAAGAAIGIAVAGVVASFKILQKVAREVANAFEAGRRIYAKTLMSGLGLGFTINRANLASVIGVDEKEVFQFGAAMAYLAPKLKFSNDEMKRTTPNLTAVAFEFEVLKKNLQATFMVLANELGPILIRFISMLSNLVKGLAVGIEAIAKFARTNASLLSKMISGWLSAVVGFTPKAEVIKKWLESLGTDIAGGLNPAQSMMKQLPVSSFERMGLVIGGFGAGADYARRTAAATEKTAKLLERGIGIGGGNFGDPLYNAP